MTQARALIVLAALALAPSVWRAVRPDPQPTLLRSTEYTAEADRVFFGEKMDLNRVDAAGLELIPGIGPSLARRIVEDRDARGPFRSVEELERVRGIGPAKRRLLEAWTRTPDQDSRL